MALVSHAVTPSMHSHAMEKPDLALYTGHEDEKSVNRGQHQANITRHSSEEFPKDKCEVPTVTNYSYNEAAFGFALQPSFSGYASDTDTF